MTATATTEHSPSGPPVRRPPACGPFGLAVLDEGTGRWKRSLTPEGWAALDEWMREVPDGRDPKAGRDLVGLLSHCYPTTRRAAEAAGMTGQDVYQWCYVGCVRAMQTFDPARDFVFSSYAVHWMRHAVGRATDRMSPHRRHGKRVISLSAPASTSTRDGDYDLLSTLGGERAADSDANDLAKVIRQAVQKAIPDPRYREILAARYGLDGNGEKSLTEVGQLFGLSRERIRQLMVAAEERLRRFLWPMAEELGGAFRGMDPPPERSARGGRHR